MLLLLCYLSLPLIYSLNTCLFIISKGERQFFIITLSHFANADCQDVRLQWGGFSYMHFLMLHVSTTHLLLVQLSLHQFKGRETAWFHFHAFSMLLSNMQCLPTSLYYSLYKCFYIISKGEGKQFHYYAFSFAPAQYANAMPTSLFFSSTLCTAVSKSFEKERKWLNWKQVGR